MCMYRCVCVGSVVSVWMCDALTCTAYTPYMSTKECAKI